MRRAAATTVVSLGVVLVGLTFTAAHSAAASGHKHAAATACSVTVTVTGPTGGKLVVTPASSKVRLGDCVAISNQTQSQLSVTITDASKTVYTRTLPKQSSATGKAGFAPAAVGKDTISVSEKVLLLPFTGSGTIMADPAPKASPTATPTPTNSTSSHPSKKPTTSPNPKHKSKTPKPHATGIKLPPLPPLPTVGASAPVSKGNNPVVAPFNSSAAPGGTVTDSSTPVAAVIAGPLEPLDNNHRGLPIAVGVFVVLGLATGWGRVLLAQSVPVDSRRKPDHRA